MGLVLAVLSTQALRDLKLAARYGRQAPSPPLLQGPLRRVSDEQGERVHAGGPSEVLPAMLTYGTRLDDRRVPPWWSDLFD